MKINRLATVATALSVGLFFSSCASISGGDPKVHEARGKFETRQTYTQGIVGGAFAGAAAGALIGALTGGENRGEAAATGAMIGAAGGGIAGGIYANEKVRQRAQYARAEDGLDKAIANAKSTRQAAASFNNTLEGRLRDVRADQKALNGTLADSRAVLMSIDRELEYQRKNLANAKAANLSQSDRNKLSSEIQGLQSQRTRLERNIRKLAPDNSDAPST